MKALERIFKDKRFLALHEKILKSMGDGLAIGFYPSQWYANLVLAWVDREIKQRILPECKYVRYMDDMVMLCSNKRKLHRAREAIIKLLQQVGLMLKGNWQAYKIKGRGVAFLSYRFFHGYTLMSKRLMYRISRRIKRAARNLTPHNAMSIISYMGILKHCDSYHYRLDRVYPYVGINQCKGVIRHEKCRANRSAVCTL
jgi:hypothetical protein